MRGLGAPLPGLARSAQQPVERRQRLEVGALIQQDGPDFGWGQVGEPLRVQGSQDRRPLRRGQRPRLRPVTVRHQRPPGRGPGSVSAPSEIVSTRACSFAWTSTTKRAFASSCSSRAFSSAAERSARPAGQPPGARGAAPAGPGHRSPAPATTRSGDWNTGPRGAGPHPSRQLPSAAPRSGTISAHREPTASIIGRRTCRAAHRTLDLPPMAGAQNACSRAERIPVPAT